MMTDEELVPRADNAWHEFRRVELSCGDPEREAAMKDELVNYIPHLIEAAQRLRAREAALVAERERLQNQVEAMREVVAFVAGAPYAHWPTDYAESLAVGNEMRDKALAILHEADTL